MLVVSLTCLQSPDLIPEGVEGIELRLDQFTNFDLLPDYLSNCKLPTILTLRRRADRSEMEREVLIRQLLLLKPTFFDLESDMRPEFLQWAVSQGIKIILSYHNFDETPADLDSIYFQMKAIPAYTYKIAALANSSCDALRLLLFARSHRDVSAISMGEKGSFARILGPLVANQIDYGFMDHPTALGQLSVRELIETYRFKSLGPQTALYGLIGDPIQSSLGHIFHNGSYEKNQIDAVYVKMVVQAEELETFIPLAKQIGFRGLSVTMPLKQRVLPDQGAVNTLFLDEETTGLSIDGIATLDAIGDVKNKEVVIIGAGGTARAVLVEALKRGASVTLLNRTLARAVILAADYGCEANCLTQVPLHYDILINCTPCSMPIKPEEILNNVTVADLVYTTKLTPFLAAAQLRGCRLVYGQTIFENQAEAQFNLWHQR